MRKLLVVVLLVFNSLFLFAQKAAYAANSVTDTTAVKWGKVKITDGAEMLPVNDIADNISHSKECSVLNKAIQGAGLIETFKSKGPITIFAPTNQAFAKLPAGRLDSLLKPSHRLDLNYLITYHALAGKITVKDIQKKINSSNGQAIYTTIAGSKLIATIDSNRNIVLIDENGGQCIISKFNIQQRNGMLHMVNAVLVPKAKVL